MQSYYAARATEYRGAGFTLPEDPTLVKLRVVTDQPWDVPADVLVVHNLTAAAPAWIAEAVGSARRLLVLPENGP